MSTYKVVAIAVGEVHPDDEAVAGVYEFEVTGDVGIEDAVLDEFHDQVGIKVLDSFYIVVLDENDNIMSSYNENVDAHAEYLGKVSDEIPSKLKKKMKI